MSFAEYSSALVEEVRRSTPANASCIVSAEAAEEWLTHFWVAAAADEDDGRTAPPPIPYKLARVVVHGTGAAGAAGIAAHGGLRAAQTASRVAVRPRPRAAAHVVCMTCGGRDPTCGCARAAGLFMKAASASRPLDHVYVAGSVDAAAFYTKAPKAERRCAAHATRAASFAILGGAASHFSLVLTAHFPPARSAAGTSCASHSPMRPTT